MGVLRLKYKIEYSNRKSLGITVTPESQLLVKAPGSASGDRIKAVLRKKAPWIIKQQNFFLSFQPKTPARKFVNGETHLYLGRQYQLKIIAGENESVKLKGRLMVVMIKDKSSAKQVLKNWYLNNARSRFDLVAKLLIDRFTKYHVKPSSIVLREMPTRWGSCTPNGKIILNPELIKAPKGCLEYVIVHELCHLVHRDHTKKFFDLQTKEMKDWQKWKMKLERLLA